MKNFTHKANLTFAQIVAAGVAFALVFGLAASQLFPALALLGQTWGNKLEVVCGCSAILSVNTNPWVSSLLLTAGVLMVAFVIYVFFRALKIITTTLIFQRQALRLKKNKLSPKLQQLTKQLGIEKKVIEIQTGDMEVFCYGMFKSRICVSSRLVKILKRKELKAVLLHEKHHLLQKEPLKLFILNIIRRVLFFVPGVRSLFDYYLTMTEIAADQYATNNFSDRGPLARALFKVLGKSSQNLNQRQLALSFFGLVTDQRIDQLAGKEVLASAKMLTVRINLAIFFTLFVSIFAALLVIINTPAQVEASASGWCELNHSVASTECRLIDPVTPACVHSPGIDSNVCQNVDK